MLLPPPCLRQGFSATNLCDLCGAPAPLNYDLGDASVSGSEDDDPTPDDSLSDNTGVVDANASANPLPVSPPEASSVPGGECSVPVASGPSVTSRLSVANRRLSAGGQPGVAVRASPPVHVQYVTQADRTIRKRRDPSYIYNNG